jgi:hypothetical protein
MRIFAEVRINPMATLDSLSRLRRTNALRSDLLDALERHIELVTRLAEELDRYYVYTEAAHAMHAALAARIGACVEPAAPREILTGPRRPSRR